MQIAVVVAIVSPVVVITIVFLVAIGMAVAMTVTVIVVSTIVIRSANAGVRPTLRISAAQTKYSRFIDITAPLKR